MLQALQLKVPPPLYLLLAAFAMWVLAQSLPLLPVWPNAWRQAGWYLIGLALLADLWSIGLFWRTKTTVNPIRADRTKHLVTDGLYQYSRNPMYLGMVFMLVGWGLYLTVLSPFLLIPLFIIVMTELQIKAEEVLLLQKFGNDYKRYCEQVRRWL